MDDDVYSPSVAQTSPLNVPIGSPFPIAPMKERSVPEPRQYVSRRESEERRRHASTSSDDSDEQEDDDFVDREAERIRIAKNKKEDAVKSLANIKATRTPKSSGGAVVEVPSTSNGRRRSDAEDYIAQCSGEDARDTQQDVTIADSQTVIPPTLPASVEDVQMDNAEVSVHFS